MPDSLGRIGGDGPLVFTSPDGVLARLAAGDPLPEFGVHGEERGWASFLTSDFLRNRLLTPF